MSYIRVFTKTPKKKARKPTAAEREAMANMAKLEAKWDKQYGKLTSEKRRPAEIPKLAPPPGREAKVIGSRTTSGGDTSRKQTPVYTGDKMLGLGQMHKSNMVPIFRTEDAVAIATMRRS